ncbi:MAG: T9SS type A sorting domain-containing protein [Bacteroidales bacterium]|nr:T9SS type A sorting domain-containing protein [Bacteroidales bacterium]
MTYEFYVKDGEGNFLVAPASITGGENDGKRLILKHGNAFLNKSITLYDLPQGNYTWSVQAIDASFEGSAFAQEGSFSIGSSNVNEFTESLVNIYSINETLVVEFTSENEGTVSVFTITGQKINSVPVKGKNFRMNLSQGIYIVSVNLNGESVNRKVVIQ